MNTSSFPSTNSRDPGNVARGLVVGFAALALVVNGSVGQTNTRPSLTLSAGIAEYDLAGTGTTGVGMLGASFPLASFFSIDPGIGYLRYGGQVGSNTTFLMPEASARFQIPGRTVNPFLSLGGGFATTVAGSGGTDATLHVAIGTYLWVAGGWGLRPEARVRSIEPFVGTTADLTMGLSRRI